ncbi:MAG TPA: hypothetical protein VNY34_05155 [Solirubrobacteraceae bacterium]|nr:hypothetical protein [Solirubrobacteraceae bacterium]
MTDFLNSLKSDLLERRMLPLVVGLAVAVVAAVGYAVLGGSSAPAPLKPVPLATHATGIVVSQAPANPDQPVAETTNGTAVQRKGNARNPFAPIAVAAVKVSTSSTSKTSSSSSSSSSTSSTSAPSGSSKGESVGSTPTKPQRTKIIVHFHVTAQFGVVPAAPAPGTPALPSQLKSYENLGVDQPLPNKDNPQLVYLGVLLPAGKSAVFALSGEAILHGNATCLPSATQCRAIALQPKQSELLETFDANNNPVTYEVKLVSITKTVTTASAAKAAHAALNKPAKAQLEQLRQAGITVLRGLKSSPGSGTLVFVRHRARSARAHAALVRRLSKG